MGDGARNFTIITTSTVVTHEIEACPISNEFHESDEGCYIIKTDSYRRHVYRQQAMTHLSNGQSIYESLGMSWVYEKEPFADHKLGYVFKTDFPYGTRGIEESLETYRHVREFLRDSLINYHTLIRPRLATTDDNTQYDLSVNTIFDCAVRGEFVIQLRPVKLILTREPDNLFFIDQRRAFFTILKIFASRHASTNAILEGTTDGGRRVMKDVKVCSAYTFTSSRSTPQEFKCEFTTRDKCVHITENSMFGKTVLARPTRLCSFLLAQMIDDHSEHNVNQLFNFRCQYATNHTLESSMPLGLVHQKIFGRTTLLHRMCLPDEFLGKVWYEWYLKKVVGVDINVPI